MGVFAKSGGIKKKVGVKFYKGNPIEKKSGGKNFLKKNQLNFFFQNWKKKFRKALRFLLFLEMPLIFRTHFFILEGGGKN